MHDPLPIVESARLAPTNATVRATERGASQRYTAVELEKAEATYICRPSIRIPTHIVSIEGPAKSAHATPSSNALDGLVQNTDGPTRLRPNSLTTPHAMAWLSSTPLTTTVTAAECHPGHRWVGGHPLRATPYRCPDCGAEADPFGARCDMHTIGFITQGHNALNDTAAEIFSKAGMPAQSEQPLPSTSERPADVLTTTWRGKPVAMDLTLKMPSRASAIGRISSTSSTTLMDQAAAAKERKSKEACKAWDGKFSPSWLIPTVPFKRTRAHSSPASFNATTPVSSFERRLRQGRPPGPFPPAVCPLQFLLRYRRARASYDIRNMFSPA